MADQDQVIDRSGIGYDQLHGLEIQFLEGAAFFLEVFERIFLIDAVRLKKAIDLHAAKPQHLAKLHFGDTPGAEFFEGEAFKRPAGKVSLPTLYSAACSNSAAISATVGFRFDWNPGRLITSRPGERVTLAVDSGRMQPVIQLHFPKGLPPKTEFSVAGSFS